ncbi:hypothetical protein CGZ91_11775 [Parenemella sanctibonifatiensis]|uniref:Uncharacterized protein n=2 Tax=Parenemella sanctibonifatiensis TaxID=2016505 RepID=A0A255EJD8_9ACTN|nr:hypothetical protein CGZ91_11775 [Parenemella sanctibonifatiensis]
MKKPGDLHGPGRQGRTKQQWVQSAREAVLHLLERELVAPRVEIDRRLHELRTPAGVRFDPHIIGEAITQLTSMGAVTTYHHTTKGGRSVELLGTGLIIKRSTEVTKRVRRKGMLYARFLRLTTTAGKAGEFVVDQSLRKAGTHLIPMSPAGWGEVSRVGPAVMNGPLDAGAWLQSIDAVSGLPKPPIGIPIEVKNRRLVIYPTHKEVHQLLYKGAVLQTTHPNQAFVPALICRRVHRRSFWMARDLGFLIHPTEREYVYLDKTITPRLLDEVRNELALDDLTPVDPAKPPQIIQFFQETLKNRATTQAARWRLVAPLVLPIANQLRKESTAPPAYRAEAIRSLRAQTIPLLEGAGFECGGGWSLPDRVDDETDEDDEDIDYADYDDETDQ